MKIKLFFSALLSFVFCLLSSQVPQGFNYQAIARNSNGIPITNQVIPVRISIVTSLTGGTVIWQEDHSSVTADQYGLISLVVGTGTQSGGSAASFSAIDWSAQTLFLKTEVKYPGPGWTEMGTSQIWAVPYSLQAKNVGPLSKLGITGTTTDMEEALFEVKNQAGNTVFAVYNEGIRAYVGNGDAKGKKGGFSVGGYDATKGTTIYDLLTLNTDSARLYFDSKPNLKGKKGGFSVGGYDMTKGGTAVQNYLDVSNDSVRIYIDSDPLTKGKKGGFAVGGYDMTKGTNDNYLNVNTDATGIVNPVNRILWYPNKNAFLAGNIRIGTPDSVGINSFATGYQSKSRGMYSQAMGFKAIANGDYSTAIGKNAVANNINSFAFGDGASVQNNDSYSFGAGAIATGIGSYAIGSAGRDTLGNLTGLMTSASGNYSFAIGQGSSSSGILSFSMGSNVVASGKSSCAIGYHTVASGSNSTAMGLYSEASGVQSTAMGTYTKAKGVYSIAIGMNAIASGYASYAFGSGATASANYSTSLGFSSVASGSPSTAMGDETTASGQSSTAMGSKTTASGYASTAMGGESIAIKDYSTAMGYKTTASENYSTALGCMTTASGTVSTTFGIQTKASGPNSTAMGQNTNASGSSSTAMGAYTTASGSLSTAIGYYVTAPSFLETVIGQFNTDYTPASTSSWNAADRLFVIGNGTVVTHSNALTVIKNGNIGIGTAAPGQKLDITAGNGRVQTGYSWLTNSDVRYKKNIYTLEGCLEKVMAMRGVSFELRNDSLNIGATRKNIGFIAQELENVVPEVVVTGSDGYKAVAYDKITAVLTEAIKEQQQQIESQQKEIDDLKTVVNRLIANQTTQVNKH